MHPTGTWNCDIAVAGDAATEMRSRMPNAPTRHATSFILPISHTFSLFFSRGLLTNQMVVPGNCVMFVQPCDSAGHESTPNISGPNMNPSAVSSNALLAPVIALVCEGGAGGTAAATCGSATGMFSAVMGDSVVGGRVGIWTAGGV